MAFPYLLREKPDIPLIGSKLTLALIEAKLQEHRIRPYTLEVAEGHRERIGPFDCEFVAVNHSIPDALAVAIRTPAGMVVHTGDFKMDQLPLDGRLTDLHAFARLERGGHRPAARATPRTPRSPASSRTSATSANVLRQVFGKARKRIIVASFASHVHRIQQILDAAHEYGRRVAFVGRSMVRNMGIARDLGYLQGPARAWSSTSRRSTTCRTRRSSWSARAPRASRWRPSPGWPTATTRSASSRATP